MTASTSPMLIPKPEPRGRTPFIPALSEFDLAHLIASLAPIERRALTQIAEAADLLMVGDRPWLLVPVSPWLLDTPAALNAESEDREPCMDDEEQPDDEENHDRENDLSDYEPDHDEEYDYRVAPRWLIDRRSRAFDAHEKRTGSIAVEEISARDLARVLAKRGG